MVIFRNRLQSLKHQFLGLPFLNSTFILFLKLLYDLKCWIKHILIKLFSGPLSMMFNHFHILPFVTFWSNVLFEEPIFLFFFWYLRVPNLWLLLKLINQCITSIGGSLKQTSSLNHTVNLIKRVTLFLWETLSKDLEVLGALLFQLLMLYFHHFNQCAVIKIIKILTAAIVNLAHFSLF